MLRILGYFQYDTNFITHPTAFIALMIDDS